MAKMRVSMRKIREVLRLTHELRLSVRQVREATGVGKTAVSEYVSRAKVIGITWPIPPEIGDAELERRLFTPAGFHDGPTKPVPDWTKVHEELKRRGVTLMTLWEEHRAECADGHGYSRFCELYSEWRKRLSPTMRQTHVAGDKLFVDWAGDTVPIIDAMTGEVHEAHLFVAALGASSYTYAEARWTETLPDWICAHVNALDFLGGVPKAAVPDNLKTGITKPSRYEPGVNRTYQELADHYGFVVLPARVRRPRDKAKVEAAVGIVSRFVLGKLRNRRFFSLAELNDAVRDCVATINAKVMKRLKQSRNDLFASLDRPALKGLPGERYQYAEWKRCTVAPDYHVEVDDHYYSVPFALLRETVDARFTNATVEVFHKGSRIASHVRSRVAHKHSTTPEHMPSSHRRYAEWSPARMLREAGKIGPATIALFEAIMKAKPHPEQGFRSCLGIMSLVKSYGPERIEAAAKRGNDIGATTYGSIKSILQNGLDRAFAKPSTPDATPIRHPNIRGRDYYH
ncbi:MAG: IS21 family transposase [Gammaproteobacteria bacterium]|nr:IS21 family transposase [Gammaproteobacteria bacterium]